MQVSGEIVDIPVSYLGKYVLDYRSKKDPKYEISLRKVPKRGMKEKMSVWFKDSVG